MDTGTVAASLSSPAVAEVREIKAMKSSRGSARCLSLSQFAPATPDGRRNHRMLSASQCHLRTMQDFQRPKVPSDTAVTAENTPVLLINLGPALSQPPSCDSSPSIPSLLGGTPRSVRALNTSSVSVVTEKWYNRRPRYMLNEYYDKNYTLSAKIDQARDSTRLTVTDLWNSAKPKGHTFTPKLPRRTLPVHRVAKGVLCMSRAGRSESVNLERGLKQDWPMEPGRHRSKMTLTQLLNGETAFPPIIMNKNDKKDGGMDQ